MTYSEFKNSDGTIISLDKLEEKILENHSADSRHDRVIKDILKLYHIKAIEKSSKSSDFLAKVGIFLGIVGVFLGIVGLL